MTKLSVGINEVSDYKRTLEWEGQDTKLARLISLANKFDAEIEFKTYLNDDSTIKQFLVNVYHENDGVSYHGVGRDRKDITLVYGKNIKTIRRKIDKTNIFNMIVPTAQSEENSDQKLTIGSLPNWELKNDKGIVEFYKRGDAIYAPISAQLYPSTFTPETQSDQWTRRDMDFNVKSIQQLETEGLKQLKASAYPELTYEFDGYIDADIGDTVELSDSGFANTLLIEARIFEQKLSFSTRKNWKTTLGNFRALQSKLSSDIQSELERLVENAKPYNIRISTDNGTMFKNNEGESLVKATLWKGGKVVNQDVSWRWALDGVVTVGMQYLVKAKDIDETAVLTVAGYVGNTEVATTEITLANLVEQIELKVMTSNGNTFKNGVIASTLTATLWRGNKEIDKDGTEFSYIWTKTNDDETPDEHWNADHSYSQKSIRISQEDVFRRATFSCEIEYIGKQV
jgi:phage minor structural protein